MVDRVLFERRCAGCDRSGAVVCPRCLALLEPAPPGIRPPALHGRVDSFAAAVIYDELAARVILAAKNGGRRDVLVVLAAATVAALDPGVEVDAVAWVPASRSRRRCRGYDQGEVLARAMARRLRVPARRLLRRAGRDAQANLARAQRLDGPSIVGARRTPPPAVLLVDDVTTTGSSVASSAAALREVGAVEVHAAVVAVVDDRRPRR